MKSKIELLAIALVTAMLTACGGGGSTPTASTTTPPVGVNPAPTPAPTPAPAPASTPVDVVTSVPAPTYPTNSNEYAFFTALNAFRASQGLGLYTQNAKLDLSSKNHAAYLGKYASYNPGGTIDIAALNTTTGLLEGHSEHMDFAGSTGATPLDRAVNTMYASDYVAEEVSNGSAAVSLAGLINTVYHRYGMMEQIQREIGLAFVPDAVTTSVVTVSTQTGVTKQNVPDNFTAAYPSDKATGIQLVTDLEAPNPYTDITYADYGTKTSSPISFASKQFTTLAVTSFTVTEAGQTTPLPVRLLTKSTNADTQHYLGGNVAFIAGYAPFKSKTVYNVVFIGTVNGTPVSKAWSFTTA